MIIGKETGIGTALRVFRHFTGRQRFHQIKFQSGERALVLIAGMPSPSVEIVRLGLGGVVPWQTVWAFNPMRAGGYGDYVHKLKSMFSPATAGSDDSLNCIREALLRCRSIEEARMLLLHRERLANSSNSEITDVLTRHEPKSVLSNDGWKLGAISLQDESLAYRTKPDGIHNRGELSDGKPKPFFPEALETAKISAVPDRYRIREDSQGKVLTCVEAPTITVRAERGIAISAKQARSYPAGTIFLDGAVQGEPFADTQKEVYSLKHPEGCIRSLATCEQAILLIRKLGDPRMRDWVVFANDGDLDTIFAVWVLLNHLRLNDDPEVCAKVMPLLRLEGVIDAHGHDAQYLAALPADVLHSTSTMLKQLRQQETVFKGYGRWSEMDLLEYVADRLRAVDELVYAPEDFVGLHEVEELARAEIATGSVAVVCRSKAGVNEVERQLQRVYGPRLGILIFQNTLSGYSLRQIDRTLPAMFQRAYERLNLLDPAVRGGSQNRWDGSTEGGASPRKTGTELTPSQIIEAVREAFRETTIVDVVSEVPRAVFLTVAALLPTLALIFVGNLLRDHRYVAGQIVPLSAVALTITVGIFFWLKARRVSGLYGWRPPKGFRWLVALPAALVGAVAGGVWAPESLGHLAPHNLYELTAAFLFPVGAELLFRGVILGQLAARLPIQKSDGPWCGSWPTLISSAVYAAASVLLFLSFSNGQLLSRQCFIMVFGALTFGVASGIARERSESVLSSVLFHCLCVAALLISGKFRF